MAENYEKFLTRDKKMHNISIYLDKPFFLDIVVKDGHIFDGWILKSRDELYVGKTKDELLGKLRWLKGKYNIRKSSGHKKEIIIVYIDNIAKIQGFFYNNITDSFGGLWVQLLDCIEFRPYTTWTKENAEETMETWFKTFRDEKYAYLTPAQCMRKRIAKAGKHDELIHEIYPHTYDLYNYMMDAVYGGVLYCKMDDGNKAIDRPMLGLDITSAYIHGLIFQKHCMSKIKAINTSEWENFFNRDDIGSIGTYRLKYAYPFSKISCFKDSNGNSLKSGMHEVIITLDNVDLEILFNLKNMTILECDCMLLYSFELDYLPNWFRDLCIHEYIKKSKLTKDSTEYKNQKILLNGGFFGNLITRDVERECAEFGVKEARQLYKKKQKESCTLPQWGVFTMSYTKKLVFDLAEQVTGWRYSDTDSIYSDDTEQNRLIVEAYNAKIREKNKVLCEKFGYDYEDLKDLGTFKIEAEITKFRAWGNKTYAYLTRDNNIIIKAAGCNKKEIDDDRIFDDDYKPRAGNTLFTYFDETGYYEAKTTNQLMLLHAIAIANLNK